MNKIYLQGTVSDLKFSHEYKGEKFYSFNLSSNRLSEYADKLPCIVPEVNLPYIYEDKTVGIRGEVRTRNVEANGKRHLEIYVFVKETGSCGEDDTNHVELQGCICKKPNFRETPLGRQICDVFMAVHRQNGKSDYIPCIFWGRQALRVAEMEVGKEICITGRLQSREYVKQNLFGECETKTAYELSVVELKGVE
jgi:primosomal replication protein N